MARTKNADHSFKHYESNSPPRKKLKKEVTPPLSPSPPPAKNVQRGSMRNLIATHPPPSPPPSPMKQKSIRVQTHRCSYVANLVETGNDLDNEQNSSRFKILDGRCFVLHWRRTIDKIMPKMSIEQRNLFRNTPFGHFLDIPKMSQQRPTIDELVSHWEEENEGFRIGGKLVSFSPKDVALILGLKSHGESIKLKGKRKSRCVNKLVNGYHHIANRERLQKMLFEMVVEKGKNTEFVQCLILYLFSTIMFPTSQYTVPPALYSYVDDISALGTYAWGMAVHEHLKHQLNKRSQKVRKWNSKSIFAPGSLAGCTIVLQVWLFEHVKDFGIIQSYDKIPRLFKWDCNVMPKHKTIRTKFFAIQPVQVRGRLLEADTREEHLIKPELEQLEDMRQNKGERQTKRISTRTKQVVDVSLSACEKKFQKKIDEMHKYYRKEIDSLRARIKLLESEKRCEHEKSADNEEIEEHHIKETNENKDNEDDSDDGNVEKLVCNKRKKFEEDIDHKESKIGYVDGEIGNNKEDQNADAEIKINADSKEKEIEGYVDTKIGNNKEDQSGSAEKNLSVEYKEKDIEGEMSQVIQGNKLVNAKAMKTEVYMQTKKTLSPSSLVKGVKQRENTRKAKYKEDDIYHIELRKSPTKPNSIVTPQGTVNEDFSKRYNKKKKPIISPMQMMEINGSLTNKGESIFQTTNIEKQFYAKETNMECDFIQTNQSNLSEKDKDVINIENAVKHPSKVNNKLKRPKRPRITNKEFDTISVMERISLRLFLSKYWQDRSNFLWRSHNNEIIINSTSVCRFLMNDPLDSDGIDGYMYILGLGIGMDILIFDTECICISLRVQQYVLPFLKNGAEVTTVISKLTNSIKGLMWGITSNKCQKCRYIMVPIQGSWHYSLLILDLEEKIYKAYNSDWTIDHSTEYKFMANFLCTWLHCEVGINADFIGIQEQRNCEQQRLGSVDCGVHVLRFCEGLLVDDPRRVFGLSIRLYRLRVASYIIRQSNIADDIMNELKIMFSQNQ